MPPPVEEPRGENPGASPQRSQVRGLEPLSASPAGAWRKAAWPFVSPYSCRKEFEQRPGSRREVEVVEKQATQRAVDSAQFGVSVEHRREGRRGGKDKEGGNPGNDPAAPYDERRHAQHRQKKMREG